VPSILAPRESEKITKKLVKVLSPLVQVLGTDLDSILALNFHVLMFEFKEAIVMIFPDLLNEFSNRLLSLLLLWLLNELSF